MVSSAIMKTGSVLVILGWAGLVKAVALTKRGVDRQLWDCGNPFWKGDDICDDDNNNAGCAWDGGDCCNNNKPGWNEYCIECVCKEPTQGGTTVVPPWPTEGCGVAPTEERIVGGAPANPNSIPWQVAVIWKQFSRHHPFCGGTIITSKFVMSAAHCTYVRGTYIGEQLEVRAGEHDTLDHFDGATTHQIKNVNNHPNYNNNAYDYDYSIFELWDPIVLTGSSKARAACLPDSGDTNFAAGTNFVVSGWGALKAGGNSPTVLHHVSVPLVRDETCAYLYRNMYPITPRMICAGNVEDGKIDSCQGDSGGPFTWVDPSTSRVKLIGVVSFGEGCARADYPGVYAEVTTVLSWVNSIIETP